MSDGARPVGGGRASLLVARVALWRLLRGRTVWLALLIAAVPVLLGALLGARGARDAWDDTFHLLVIFLVVVPPLVIGAAIAEEIEERTYTHVWSRPVPRWSLVTGVVLAGWPPLTALFAAAATAVFVLTGGGDPILLARGVGGGALGLFATGLASAGIAALAPGLAQRLTYGYLFVDLVIGTLPLTLRNLSVTFHVRSLAGLAERGVPPATVGDAVWCLAIGATWLAVGLLRVRRAEYAADR